MPLMIQAAVFDGEFLDPFSPFDNGGGAAEVSVVKIFGPVDRLI